MAKEYIEREATCGDCIHAEICEHMPTLTGYDPTNVAYCRTFRSAADVVEVVRCKECKFFEMDGCGWYYCKGFSGLQQPDALDFCSYGERKDDADN